MFTGLVERIGKVSRADSAGDGLRLVLELAGEFDTAIGDSVAVNGACMTVVEITGNELSFDVSSESLAKTNFSNLKSTNTVNLERAMRLGDRVGGHLVSGHIDCTASLVSWENSDTGGELKVRLPREFSRYTIAKGSLCLDGISLTINKVEDSSDYSDLSFMIIPHTVKETHLHTINSSHQFNVEVDMMAKFVERVNART